MSRVVRRLTALSALALWVAGCSKLAGIEDATLDPEYDAGADASSGLSCATYCDAVMTNCVDPLQQYKDLTTCEAVCSHLALGTLGDDTGNTVACRLTHAIAASSTGEPTAECPVAGPTGDGVCGSNCDGYCTLMHAICPDKLGTIDDCFAACAAVPDLGAYNFRIQSGNSIQCRLYHVSAASLVPSTHCPHAAGEAICISPDAGP